MPLGCCSPQTGRGLPGPTPPPQMSLPGGGCLFLGSALSQLPHLQGRLSCGAGLPWARFLGGCLKGPLPSVHVLAGAEIGGHISERAIAECSQDKRSGSGSSLLFPGSVGEKGTCRRGKPHTPHTGSWFQEVGGRPQGPCSASGSVAVPLGQGLLLPAGSPGVSAPGTLGAWSGGLLR